MNTSPVINLYERHRLTAEIISHSFWLFFRSCLSYWDVEALMVERGLMLTHEAVRYWCRKFGQTYTNQLRCRHPQPGGKWHLNGVFLTTNGKRHYTWRAEDENGNVLDLLMQRRRDKAAAKTFFRELLKGLKYVPRVIITDNLASYGGEKRKDGTTGPSLSSDGIGRG